MAEGAVQGISIPEKCVPIAKSGKIMRPNISELKWYETTFGEILSNYITIGLNTSTMYWNQLTEWGLKIIQKYDRQSLHQLAKLLNISLRLPSSVISVNSSSEIALTEK